MFLASARETAAEGNAAEHRLRISAEFPVFWLRVRRCGGGLGCAAHVCASAPFLHMETWCCVPRHKHRKWHGRLARRQNIRQQTACLLCDQTAGPSACAVCGGQWSGPKSWQCNSAVVSHSIFQNSWNFAKSPAFLGIWDYCHQSRQYFLPYKICRSCFRWRARL